MACSRIWLTAATLAIIFAGGQVTPADAQAKANITGLSDVAFGTASFTGDLTNSQSICVYVGPTLNNYNVTARGSGAGSAFTLAAGSGTLPYDVEWSATAGQTSGMALAPGVPRTGYTSLATASNCIVGLATSASLILRLRAAQVSVAQAGVYSGTLSITIAPE